MKVLEKNNKANKSTHDIPEMESYRQFMSELEKTKTGTSILCNILKDIILDLKKACKFQRIIIAILILVNILIVSLYIVKYSLL